MLPCVCMFSNRSQRMSKFSKNISDTLGCCALCATFLFLPHFDVICDLLLNRRTAPWNLFVNWIFDVLQKQLTALLNFIHCFTFLWQYIHEEEGVSRPPFSEESYLKGDALKEGEDKYNRNQFNQAASDALGGDRSIPDTRHSQ